MTPALFLGRAATAFLLVSALAPANAAAPAASPAISARPALNSTEAGLWLAVDQAEKDMQTSPLLVRDEALNTYVKKLVCDLAGPACGEVRIYILDYPYFNATAYPNGALQVWTGLLLRSENEAQLAFVLGHEITHFQKRHTLRQFESARDASSALAAFSIITAGAGVGLVGSAASLAAVGAFMSYTRGQESEADDGGFDIAVAQGYDARQAAAIWKLVEDEAKANPNRNQPSIFLSNHPSNAARLAAMTKRAEAITSEGKAANLGTDAYRAVIAPHRAKWLEAELNRGALSESLVLIDRLKKAESESAELAYFQAEAYRRRNAKGDLDSALTAYQSVAGTMGAPPAAYRGLGLVALKAGKAEVARNAFQTYLSLVPNADDKATIEYYLTSVGARP